MKKYIIVGMGRSGLGVATLLDKFNIKYDFYDENIKSFDRKDVVIYNKDITDTILKAYDTMILSPGVSIYSDIVKRAENLNIKVIGEVEFAFNYIKNDIIAITGTNGKTTTTTLVGEILSYKYKTALVGNIGNSIANEVAKGNKELYVAEISSFQLESVDKFRPHISAILNITPDHLDRHFNMKCYEDTKFNIANNQGNKDYIVLNYDDDIVRNHIIKSEVNKVYFSLYEKVYGSYIKDESIYFNDEYILDLRDIKILGKHNISNILAAVAICKLYKVESEIIKKVISNFMGVEHRIEYVDTIRGVKYYNDSKGTNTDAAIFAINAMPSKTILIAGGYDKKADYTKWLEVAKDKVKLLILMGETSSNIKYVATNLGYNNIIEVNSMKEALDKAYEFSKFGENVLLSPACASWGMYPNYEVRGKDFKENVRRLKQYEN